MGREMGNISATAQIARKLEIRKRGAPSLDARGSRAAAPALPSSR
jgi:hypothetical protein